MGRVYLEFDGMNWREVETSNFWIDRALLTKLDNIKKIQRKDWDGLILIDGKERSGKSVLGMICGWYLSDCKLGKINYARGLEDCARKIADIPDRSVVVLDEASIVFSTKHSLDKRVKLLLDILDVVGQKNLVFIFCNPSFFDLNKTIATRRSLFLLHVYPNAEYERGQYAFWGEKAKAKLFRYGKKNFDSYDYPRAEFVGEFFQFEPPFYQEYLIQIKKETLNRVLLNAIESVSDKSIKLYNYKVEMAGRINKYFHPTTIQLAHILNITHQSVSDYLNAYEKSQTRQKAVEKAGIGGDDDEFQGIKPTIIKTFPKSRLNNYGRTPEEEDPNLIGGTRKDNLPPTI